MCPKGTTFEETALKEVEERAGIRRGQGYGVPKLGKIEYFKKFVISLSNQ